MSEWKKNDKFETVIEDISETGEGIGKTDGFTWFIKDTVIGDRVEAKAMKTKVSGCKAMRRLSASGYGL